MSKNMRDLSVYIHIPFCRRKCAYCDFVSFADREAGIPEYTAAVCSEIREKAGAIRDRTIRTVYVGGGTPSLLPGGSVAAVLSALRNACNVSADAEITVEANPESVTEEKAAQWLHAGVNRVSLGVQSFRDAELRMLGRLHDAKTARNAFCLLQRSGFENVSLDLMYGLPGQEPSDWRESLAAMQSLKPRHISCYQLIPEEGTPLEAQMRSGALPAAAQEEALLQMDRMTEEAAEACGLRQYEVSNYALPGYECRHNMNYWECGSYLGIGCAAHADFGGRRTYNTESLQGYLSGEPAGRGIREDQNDLKDRRFERVMMGLRMRRGMDRMRFRRDFGGDPEEFWPESIRFMQNNQFLHVSEERMMLTKNGMRVMNALLVRMLEEQDNPTGANQSGMV